MSISAPVNYNSTNNSATLGSFTLSTGATVTATAGSISAGTATGLTLNSPNATTANGTTLTIDSATGDSVTSTPITASQSGRTYAEQTGAISANSGKEIEVTQDVGFIYTQYGYWYQCSANCLNGTSTEVDGVFVQGQATPTGSVPTTGTATYTGGTRGTYVDINNLVQGDTQANLTAVANFATRNVSFSTTGSTVTNIVNNASVTTPNPNLNITGTLSYGNIIAGGRYIISGTVNSTAMTGNASGQFNGPTAQEIGGVYNLSGSAGKHFGAFIGKQ